MSRLRLINIHLRKSISGLQTKNRFLTDSAILLTGTVVGQGLSFLAAPFVGRLYTPMAFGEAAISLALILALSVVACGRYDQAIMLPAEEFEAKGVLLSALAYCCGLTALISLGCLIASWLQPLMMRQYHLWAVPVGVWSNGMVFALTSWLLRQRSFILPAASRALSGLVLICFQLGLALAGQTTSLSLVMAYLGSVLSASLVLLFGLDGRQWRCSPGLYLEAMLRGARRYRSFPLVEAWGSLLNSSGGQLPVFILASTFPATYVGAYTMAHRLLSLPIMFVAGSLGQVFFQRVTAERHAGKGMLPATRSLFRQLVIPGAGPFLIVALFGETLVTFLLGPQWTQAGLYMQYLSLGLFCQFLFSPISPVFFVLEAQKKALVVHVLVFFTPLVALSGGIVLFGENLSATILLLSGALAALYGPLALWCLRLARAADANDERIGYG